MRRLGSDRGPDGRSQWPDDRSRGLRPHPLLRRSGDRWLVDDLQTKPQSPRDRFSVHGVLHRRELRLLHPVPSGQRASQGEARQDPGRSRRGVGSRPISRSWRNTVKTTSRCGLGQTSAHPVLSTLKNFRQLYEQLLREPVEGRNRVRHPLCADRGPGLTGRDSVHFQEEQER